mmetsp:Transcript_20375/g.47862  ORF Transcript_20375/g.47862 Transcript_20375/m.47862 type:complete len:101 (-) Transcript_20375:3650-3952(-)
MIPRIFGSSDPVESGDEENGRRSSEMNTDKSRYLALALIALWFGGSKNSVNIVAIMPETIGETCCFLVQTTVRIESKDALAKDKPSLVKTAVLVETSSPE